MVGVWRVTWEPSASAARETDAVRRCGDRVNMLVTRFAFVVGQGALGVAAQHPCEPLAAGRIARTCAIGTW